MQRGLLIRRAEHWQEPLPVLLDTHYRLRAGQGRCGERVAISARTSPQARMHAGHLPLAAATFAARTAV